MRRAAVGIPQYHGVLGPGPSVHTRCQPINTDVSLTELTTETKQEHGGFPWNSSHQEQRTGQLTL